MSYYTGKALERRIKQYKLGELQTSLQALVDGGKWPGDCIIQLSKGTGAEQVRNAIYSMLLELNLKARFIVRVQHGCVKVEDRVKDNTTTFGAVHFGPASTGASVDDLPDSTPNASEPWVNPDTSLHNIFDVEE